MALLRNREVAILGKADGEDVSPVYTVIYPDGNRENVKLSELTLTEDEHKEFTKNNGELAMVNVRKINNKDLQEIRDSQDRTKIEASQKEQSTAPVKVSNVMVDPAEVQEKTPAKKVK